MDTTKIPSHIPIFSFNHLNLEAHLVGHKPKLKYLDTHKTKKKYFIDVVCSNILILNIWAQAQKYIFYFFLNK